MIGALFGTVFMMCVAALGLYIMARQYNKENPISHQFVKIKVRKFGKRRDVIARCGLRWLKLRAYRLNDGTYQCVTLGEDTLKTYGLMRKSEKSALLRAATDHIALHHKWLQMVEIITPRGGVT